MRQLILIVDDRNNNCNNKCVGYIANYFRFFKAILIVMLLHDN